MRFDAMHVRGRVSIYIVIIALILIAGAAGFFYIGSDLYKSQKDFSNADALIQQGKYADAAAIYVKWIPAKLDYAQPARQKFKDLLKSEGFKKLPAMEMAGVLAQMKLVRSQLEEASQTAFLYPIAHATIKQSSDKDPYGAYLLLNETLQMAGEQPELLQQKIVLLELLVKQRPTDTNLAVDLALIYEKQQKWKEAEALLTPHMKALGQSEGARLLGQIFASKGAVNDAYGLLKPYTESRLQNYRDAEKSYNDFINTQWDRAIADLRAGNAPQEFWLKYDKAEKADQQVMVNDFVRSRLDAIPEVTKRQERFRQAATVVPVALDLGIVLVSMAQSADKQEQRKTYLQEAETTFLAIQGAAADSPDFQFYLGQVYYWLGKFDDGKQLFDRLLANSQRSYNTLYAIANKLREVGEYSQSRTMIEEAYQKAADNQQRTAAARLRSVMQIDTNDAIVWLKRADQNDPETQISLNNAQGNRAEELGQYDQALQYYRKAIAAYTKLPETGANLNNAALVYFSVARLAKDPAANSKGLELMDKAVSMDQSNSITLHNAASVLMSVAIEEVIAGKLHPDKLAMTPTQSMLQYLYSNQQQKDQYVASLKKNPTFNKAKSYFQKVILLSPKSTSAFNDLYDVVRFIDAREEMENLVQSTLKVNPDIQDMIRSTQEYYSGKKDKEYLTRIDGQIRDTRNRLQRISKEQDRLTYAMGLTRLVSLYMSQAELDADVNPDMIVELAQQAYQLAPSSATSGSLIAALINRVSHQLVRSDAEYRRIHAGMMRKLGTWELIGAVVTVDPVLRAKLAEHADFKRSIKLIQQVNQEFAQGWSLFEWALLQAVDPQAAKDVVVKMQSDKRQMLDALLAEKYADSNVSSQLNHYLNTHIYGKDKDAINKIAALLGVKK